MNGKWQKNKIKPIVGAHGCAPGIAAKMSAETDAGAQPCAPTDAFSLNHNRFITNTRSFALIAVSFSIRTGRYFFSKEKGIDDETNNCALSCRILDVFISRM